MATHNLRPAYTPHATVAQRGSFLPLAALSVVAISVWTAWFGGVWQANGGDNATVYAPAMNALLDGRFGAFFADLPVNGAGGSVLLRAPFALIGKELVGGQLAIYRFGTLACLLALGALGLWLAQGMYRRGASPLTCVGVVALYACTPALLEAVFYGHPEEPLGAVLCIAAVLLAGAGRPQLAGALLGAAVINKAWGVLALGPVLLCVAPGQRTRVILPAGAIVGAWLLSGALIDPSRLWLSVTATENSLVAHPQDLWWPLAHTVGLYPRPPAIIGAHARQLALALALASAAALALRARRAGAPVGVERCLALLAFGFALRCLLEPSPHDYYLLPFVVALGAWELYARGSVSISLVAAILLALDFRRLNEFAPAIPFLLYLAVLLPICSLLLSSMFPLSRLYDMVKECRGSPASTR
jgi:hypothetical protein